MVGHTLIDCQSNRIVIDENRLRDQTMLMAESRGKHLLLHFQGDLILHSHLGREGRWRLYPPSRCRTQANETISTSKHLGGALSVPHANIEILSAWSLKRHPTISRLGPDILGSEHLLDEILQRMAGTKPSSRHRHDGPDGLC